MNRRNFLKNAGLATAAASVLPGTLKSAFAEETAPKSSPNILFLFTDDHAIQAMGSYKTRLQKFIIDNKVTPNLDKLGKAGIVMNNCFCTNSICGPSRAAIITGKHSHKNGFKDNRARFDGTQQTFPKLLGKAGYQTAMLGKWHLRSKPTGFDYWEILPGQGDYYNPDFLTKNGRVKSQGYCTDIVVDKAINWLDKRDKTKPFMMMCQQKAPHRTWMPGPDHLTFLDDVKVPEPDTLFDDYKNRTSSLAKHKMGISKHMYPAYDLKLLPKLEGLKITPSLRRRFGWRINPYLRMNTAQRKKWDAAYGRKNKKFFNNRPVGKDLIRWRYQRYMKDYLRCVKSVDDNFGRLFKYLKDNNLEENTIVVYSSDQGFYLGEHGWFDKRWMYEQSLHMPFICRWPGVVKPGSRTDAFVQNIDFAPTFLEAAGVKVPSDIQGESIMPLLKGKTPASWRKSIYYHYYEKPSSHNVEKHYGVRKGQYKLIYFSPVNEWEMFDLSADPKEMNSVYDDPKYAKIRKQLKQELRRLRKYYDDKTGKEIPAGD